MGKHGERKTVRAEEERGAQRKGEANRYGEGKREEASQGQNPRETRDHNVTSQSVWPGPGLSDLAGASSGPRGVRWACSEAVFHRRWGDVGRRGKSVGKRSPGEGALRDNGEGAGEIHPLSWWGGG